MPGCQVGPYSEYERLIKKMAWKGLRRLQAAGARSIEFGDCEQQLAMTWMRCREKYDPTRGVPFVPYLVRAGWMNFNRWANQEIEKAQQEAIRLDDPMGEDGDSSLHEVIADTSIGDPLARAMELESFARVMKRLDKSHECASLKEEAKQFVRLLIDPPEEIQRAVAELQGRAQFAEQRQVQHGHTPTRLTFQQIAFSLGLTRNEYTKIMAALSSAVAA